ncbi:MAG: hypothetical protein FJW34_04320 [Acidobacteria bacterium]|nr:hypothetical protein [Acidobacteriota bacterium]
MSRAWRAAGWLAPPLFCLWLYWLGLKTWFYQDDFAWLHLRLEIHSPKDWWAALFAPMAQGTIRPWSERAFFTGFSALFGVDALPFRIWVFLTQLGSLTLLNWLARRLTGSQLAGVAAGILWTAHAALATPMAWTSAYNQVMCGFFLLAALALLVRHVETGRRRYLIGQWIVFLLGFGALEINVVYPALAAVYTLAAAPAHFRKVLPMFVPSAAYLWLHQHLAPAAATGTYGVYLDGRLPATLWRYWEWALGPALLEKGRLFPGWSVPIATALLSGALLGFTAWKLRQRRWVAVFPLAWFVIVIGPVLPLREHVSDYYLTVPLAGLALLGGWALAEAWRGGWAWRAVALALACIYLASSVPQARAWTRWRFERSREVRKLVLGVARAHQLHRGKPIVLVGVWDDLFWAGVFDQPFRLFGAQQVYLGPDSEALLQPRPEFGDITDYVLPGKLALRALDEDEIVVYQAGGARLRNATTLYRELAQRLWTAEEPRRVLVGNPLYGGQLGGGWSGIEGGHRWMPRAATVQVGGPVSRGQRLWLEGYCPAGLLAQGPARLIVSVDGQSLGQAELRQGDAPFQLGFPLPEALVGRPTLTVRLELDRIFTPPGETRSLGLVFGTFRVR